MAGKNAKSKKLCRKGFFAIYIFDFQMIDIPSKCVYGGFMVY